jgi:Holliday junction resolvase RusA-like endonuclease
MNYAPLMLTVAGTPAPQGSKTAISVGGQARLIEAGGTAGRARHKAWRAAVTDAAVHARRRATHEMWARPTALQVSVLFVFPMPASRTRADRERGWCWRTVTPDIDKLLRSTLDALTVAQVWEDDSQVCGFGHVQKIEVLTEQVWRHGAQIVVRPIAENGPVSW